MFREGAVSRLEEHVIDLLTQHNHMIAGSDTLMSVGHCELVLVDIVAVGRTNNVALRHKRPVGSDFCLYSVAELVITV